MKRALSLIIVLAMVLCMIPFSAFAADFEIAGDFADGVITLVGTETQTYLYTATETGTLAIYAEAVVPEVAEGEETPAVAAPYILVDGADYTEAIAVTAGQSYEITFGDDDGIGGDVTVWTVFTGLPGTESNPYDYYNPTTGMAPADQAATTVEVPAGESVYYNLWYYAGTTLRISGVGVEAVKVWEDKTIDGTEAGYVEFEIDAMERVTLIKITNKDAAAQTYTFEGIVPSGTQNNPEVITVGEYTVELAEGNQGYFYKYIAEGNGTVSIGVAANGTISETDSEGVTTERAIGWQYTVDPFSGGNSYYSDDAEVVNPATVEVSAGDEIIFVVGTYDSKVYGPAGSITTTVSFEAAEVGPIVIESLDEPYSVTHSGVYEQMYQYTATEAGYLYVASPEGGWMELNVGGTVWGEAYGDGYVLAMNEGDVANINLYAYWGEDTFNYNFSWMTEVTPDGSYGFPFIAEIPSDGTVVTLANDGEDAVYYAYTATEDCKIYNAFQEATIDVAAGETIQIYVPNGGIQVNYVLPVAIYNEVKYYDLQEAISAAAAVATDSSKQTVKMLTSYVNENQTLIIEPNVILDTAGLSITVKYLIGLSGSSLQCSANRFNGGNYDSVGKINVAKNNMILSDTTVAPSATSKMKVMPFWVNDTYVLGNFRVNDDSVKYEFNGTSANGDGVYIENFAQAGGTYINNIFKDNGSTDHGIRVVVRAEWTTSTGKHADDYTYLDSFVMTVASGGAAYSYTLTGLSEALFVDLSTFKVTPMIITECGAIYYGNTITYSAE